MTCLDINICLIHKYYTQLLSLMVYLLVFFVQWCAEIKQEHIIMAIMMAYVLLGEAWLIHLMKRVGPANPSNISSPVHQWASDLAANNRKTSFKSKLLPLWGEVYNCTFQGQDSHTDMSFSALFSIHFTLHISPQMLDHS